MRLVVNVHLKDGLPSDKDEYLETMEDVAEELLSEFPIGSDRPWWLTSVAVQPAPKPLMHSRDL